MRQTFRHQETAQNGNHFWRYQPLTAYPSYNLRPEWCPSSSNGPDFSFN